MAKKPAASERATRKRSRDDLIAKIQERVCAQHDRDRAAELATLSRQQTIRGWRLPEQVAVSIADEVECLQHDAQRCHSSDELRGVLFNAVANGFTFAVERYLDELRDVPELQQLRDRENRRKAKATTGKTAKRSQRALEAQRMLDQGASIDDIAAAFGRTKSTVVSEREKLSAALSGVGCGSRAACGVFPFPVGGFFRGWSMPVTPICWAGILPTQC